MIAGSATIALLCASSGVLAQTLLSDNFSDGDSSDWTAFLNGWNESNGVFHSSNTGANIPVEVLYDHGYAWQDYSVEVDVITPSSRPTSDVQLLVRDIGVDSLSASRGFAYCSLFRNNFGQTFLIAASAFGLTGNTASVPFPWNAGQVYRLRATIVGDQITCDVPAQPGATVALVDAAIPAAGTIGLRATHIPADFDNVIVTAIQSCSFGPPDPAVFRRSTGKPEWQEVTWDSCGGPGTLHVAADQVSSALIYLNGDLVFSPSDFHPDVHFLDASIDLLPGQNVLDVQLRGKPGVELDLTFTPTLTP